MFGSIEDIHASLDHGERKVSKFLHDSYHIDLLDKHTSVPLQLSGPVLHFRCYVHGVCYDSFHTGPDPIPAPAWPRTDP